MSVLIVDDQIQTPTANGRAVQSLVEKLCENNMQVLESFSYDDAKSILISDASIECVLLDWSLNEADLHDHSHSNKLLDLAHSQNSKVPIFLMARRDHAPSMDAETMRKAEELIWILEDPPDFIAGRVIAAIKRYWELIMPPFNKALMQFTQVHEYSWHTPGHTGGTAFLKSPVGREFFNYFGENLLRSDLSISVGELGSLLDHSGPIGPIYPDAITTENKSMKWPIALLLPELFPIRPAFPRSCPVKMPGKISMIFTAWKTTMGPIRSIA